MAPLLCEPSHEMPYLAMSPNLRNLRPCVVSLFNMFNVMFILCVLLSLCMYSLFLISSVLTVPSLLILLHFILQYSILAARSESYISEPPVFVRWIQEYNSGGKKAQQAEEWREKDIHFWTILQKWNIKCHKKKQEGEWPVKQKDWMGPSNINQGKSSSQSPRNF